MQLLDAQGTVRGCGLLIDSRHVLTCAHVLALTRPGLKPDQAEKPDGDFQLVFPYRRSTDPISASVAEWKPVLKSPRTDQPDDIAVLKLANPAPLGAVPHFLVLLSDWAGRGYMAHGFPESNPRGDWADGMFKGETVSGWVQMLATDGSDLQVDHGFSGAGVWDDQLNGFVGIMVANKKRGGQLKPVSYMIPTSILHRAWPDLSVALGNTDEDAASANFGRFCQAFRNRRVGVGDGFGGELMMKGRIGDSRPAILHSSQVLVVHAIPEAAALNRPPQVDFARLQSRPQLIDRIQAWTDHYSRYTGYHYNHYPVKRRRRNVDGFLLYSSQEREDLYTDTYVQFYLDGIVEAVDGRLMSQVIHSHVIPAAAIEESLNALLAPLVLAQRELRLAGRMCVACTILGELSYVSISYDTAVSKGPHAIGLKHRLALPPIVFEITDDDVTIAAKLTPMFDSLANAGGWDKSPTARRQ